MKKFDNLLQSAVKAIDADKRAVEISASALAQWMKKLHGGDWRIQIDHEVALVVVAQRLPRQERQIERASLREAI